MENLKVYRRKYRFYISIFRRERERERNIEDIEANIGEIRNSSDRSFLLFFINFFKKKKDIIIDNLDSERQPLLSKK